MAVALVSVPLEDRPLMANLMELCQHDYSEFDGAELDPSGRFGFKWLDHSWIEPTRRPFLIRVDRSSGGFALVCELPATATGIVRHSVAEFFVSAAGRRHRGGSPSLRGRCRRSPGWCRRVQKTRPRSGSLRRVVGDLTAGRFRERRRGERNRIEFEVPGVGAPVQTDRGG